jgi:hypothetical protein
MDGAEHEALVYTDFPKAHWLQIHSTNPLQRLDAEIKRRTNVVGIFPKTTPLRGGSASRLSSRATSGPCSAATCSLKPFRLAAILPPLGCLLCSAEHRVHLGLSGLWGYTTQGQTISSDALTGITRFDSPTGYFPAGRFRIHPFSGAQHTRQPGNIGVYRPMHLSMRRADCTLHNMSRADQ